MLLLEMSFILNLVLGFAFTTSKGSRYQIQSVDLLFNIELTNELINPRKLNVTRLFISK